MGDICEYLNEETLQELEKSTWPQIKRRAKSQNLKSKYVGCDDNGRLYFITTSGTTPGKYWRQQIEFKNLPEAVKILNQRLTLRKKLVFQELINGDVRTWCNDYSYHYYAKYTAWKNGYGIQKETRAPTMRNVQEDHVLCKHLISCFYTIPSVADKILDDYKRKKILPNFAERLKNKTLNKKI